MTALQSPKLETLQEKETPVERLHVSLMAIFLAYFQIGLTAFGMAIIQKIRAMVIDKNWLSEEEVNEGMGMVQLYPGPIMVDFTAYVGYKLRGVIGAILATIGFILPSFVLMSVLSAFYFAAGSLSWVHPLFLGLEALVVGVLFNVALEMGGRNIQQRTQAVIMLLAFTALLFKVNAVLIVLVALAIGALLIRPASGKNVAADKPAPKIEPFSAKRWAGIGAVVVVILAVVALAWSLKTEIGGGWLYPCLKSAQLPLAMARRLFRSFRLKLWNHIPGLP